MSTYPITKEEILEATRGGLDIILAYYPQAAPGIEKKHHKFKLREEKTASANIRQLPDGNWVVTDFGGDQVKRNGIEIARLEDPILSNKNYYECLQYIAAKFNVAVGEKAAEIFKPQISKRKAKDDEDDGKWFFEYKTWPEVTDFELQTIFADRIRADRKKEELIEVLKRYRCYALHNYSIVKNREVTTISSTDTYPIFCFDEKTWQKIYQPKSLDKARRFISYGEKPKDYLFGLSQLELIYEEAKDRFEMEQEETGDDSRKEFKLPEVINCTGGSDALNVAAMGYPVVWPNSESSIITHQQYIKIIGLTHKLFNLPDIDHTGKRQAHELALQYLDIFTIKLPETLKKTVDFRGNACKDVKDYLRYHGRSAFSKLLDNACPYRFWDETRKFDKKGRFTGSEYDVNNTYLYNFLAGNGFYQYKVQNGTADIYIQITGNIVKEVTVKDIKKFINGFLEDRGYPNKLRNTFYRTTQLTGQSFENLPHIEIDFTDCDKSSQYLFFKNQTWHVTAEGIKTFRPGEVARYVWEHNVIPHNVSKLDDFFTVSNNSAEDLDIVINNRDCLFFRYTINTTRMHWRIEENGREEIRDNGEKYLRTTLTPAEAREERLHLLNRIFTMGYMMHRYKDRSRAWAPFAIEAKMMDEEENNGGSGKSIFIKFPEELMRTVMVPGRIDNSKTQFIFEKVDERTKWVYVDDCDRYLNYGFFYPYITGDWDINPKQTKSFNLAFASAPKLGFSSGYPPHNADSSLQRRLLYTAFSDYYHHGPNEEFTEERSPRSDLGLNLFDDFDEQDWNRFLNLAAQSLRFYLSSDEKINPPMDEVTKRQLLSEMTEIFKLWADVYFSHESGRLNCEVPRDEAQEQFYKSQNTGRTWNAKRFGKSLRAWCKFYDYTFNPKDMCNAKGRMIRTVDNVSKEMIFIQTSVTQETLPF